MANKEITIGWRAPSNIALIKYWGKRAIQLPENGSLSISLDKSASTTILTFRKKELTQEGISLQYFFQGENHPKFESKILIHLTSLLAEMPFLNDFHLLFHSENNFPHSTGIASSASSMAALALCLVSMEEEVTGKKGDQTDFFRRASYIARLGSGSASRSIYGGLVTWGESASVPFSSDEYATPFHLQKESSMNRLMDAILIVSSKEKAVSSSLGHAMMTDHPYREGRKLQANSNLRKITEAILIEDLHTIGQIAENEALSLHALLISSSSGGILLKPNSLQILDEIKKFRESTGVEMFFTIDAGPNIHLIYFEDDREQILSFVNQTLSQYCEKGQWIDDKIGSGPFCTNPISKH